MRTEVRYLLAIDQGTSSSRGIIFDHQGQVCGIGQEAFDLQIPADGWVEQDPEVLWQTTLRACRQAIANAAIKADQIVGIGITNQRETTLVWDRVTGDCVYPAIVWQDRRTEAHCGKLRQAGLSDLIAQITGLVIDPYFSSTKLAWILRSVEGVQVRAEAGALCFGTVDSFLIWRLTKGLSHKTDATNASRTQLFDIHAGVWSDRLLAEFAIPPTMLPSVEDCVANFGMCDASWFGAAIPIVGVAGDQQAALIGQGCIHPGMTKSTYGTGCFVIANQGDQPVPSKQRLLTTIGYQLRGKTTYALEGSIFVAGQSIEWLQKQMGFIKNARDSQRMAEAVGYDTHGVFLVPAFTGLGAPYWRADARGLITGLTLDTTREQIVTAALQSVAFQTQELIAAMAADGARVDVLRVDGGMVVNDWLCQFLADVTQVRVDRPAMTETTALGVAMLVAVGVDIVADLAEAVTFWQPDRQFEPQLTPVQANKLRRGWAGAVKKVLA